MSEYELNTSTVSTDDYMLYEIKVECTSSNLNGGRTLCKYGMIFPLNES